MRPSDSPILFQDFSRLDPPVAERLVSAFAEVLNSGRFVLGERLTYFEESWSSTLNAGFAVGVGNGLDAIEIGLRSLKLPPGSEVITTPMTAQATVLGIMRAGLVPVLADISPDTGLLYPESVRRCITPRTRVLLLVHLYGQLGNMDEWTKLAQEADVLLAEDCAQAHLARYKGKFAGTFGEFGAFSFYPTKNLGAIGDAGAVVTNSPEIALFSSKFRNYGQTSRYHHDEHGMNSRLDELQAALLLAKLPYLEEETSRRRFIATRYRELVTNERIQFLSLPEDPLSHVHHLVVVRSAHRESLIAFLNEQNVETLIHYPIPVHRQEASREIRTDPHGLLNAELFATEILSIPAAPSLNDDEIEKVASALNSFSR